MSDNDFGESFGPYRLLTRLGEGGMGVVHIAEMVGEAGFRKRVALKRMHERYRRDPRLLEFFATEARTNARIDHPNVVHVLEFGLEPEPHIVMEYVDGVSLRALLWRYHERGWAMDLRASTLIAAEAALGLDFAHRLVDDNGIPLGVVHRDISPSNVLISKEGTVKVSDFGLAMVADNPFTANSDIPVGKPHYMAPEQAEGRKIDARADVFSLGLVLWESLTQRQLLPPHDWETVRRLLLTCNFHKPSRFNPNVPPELDWITAGCLQREPSARWSSAEALSLALRQLLHIRGQGFDRIQLANIVRGAFPERGWGTKQPAQPPPQPTRSQIARLPLAPPAAVDASQTNAVVAADQEETSPGSPDALISERPPEAEALQPEPEERPRISGICVRGTGARANTDQFLAAQLERSMWTLRSSRTPADGARLRGPSQGQLLMIVDGGLGRTGGDFGGVVAVDTLSHYVFSVMPWSTPRTAVDRRQLAERLLIVARSCVAQLRIVATTERIRDEVGVSITAAYVLWPDLFAIHAGACRCVVHRDGELHTVVGDAEEGRPTIGRVLVDEKADEHGGEMVLRHAELREGDKVMILSAGLLASVSDERIAEVLSGSDEGRPLDDLARTIALEAGSQPARDVTLVIAAY